LFQSVKSLTQQPGPWTVALSVPLCRYPGGGWEFFSSPPHPHRLSGPPSLLSNGYQCSFPSGKAVGAWSWPLTSIYSRGQECVELYLHSHNTPSWRSSQLKRKLRDNFTFTFTLTHIRVGISSGLLPSGFLTKILYEFISHPCYMPRPSHPPDLIILMIFGAARKLW